ncbi:hypothetical protein MHYP_G00104520 [Metynnis hypsauchen]
MKILLVFTLYLISGLKVTYRNLSLQDAGSYQCGEAGVWNHTVNLKVNSDPCFLGSTSVAGYLGETVTINCSYPEEPQEKYKFLFKQHDQDFTLIIRTTETQTHRFSISEDRSSSFLSVRISDVRENDGGVYYCGVSVGGQSVSYYSLYTETQLQVTAKGTSSNPKQPPSLGPSSTMRPMNMFYRTTSTAPTGTTSGKRFGLIDLSVIIISVCVCVVLMLIGGSAVIFCKLRRNKQQGSSSISRRSGTTNTANCDYENDPPGIQNHISMCPVYHNLKPKTNQSVYQSLDPNTRQPDSVYHTLNPKINQLYPV